MSISMNNHETRIKALENKGSGSWTKGSNSNGYWIKESGTGVIIQFGRHYHPESGQSWLTFPIPFSAKDSYSIACVNLTGSTFVSIEGLGNMYPEKCYVDTAYRRNDTFGWIAIGY